MRAWRETPTFGRDYFLYDGEQVVCEFRSDGSTSWYYNYGPNGLAMRSSAPTTYYVYSFDHLGSFVQRFYSGTGDGLAQKTAVYDAFGKLWWDQTSSGTMFTTPDPPGFAGQWGAYTDHETRPSDQNTPLVLMGIRYYDPITARFVTRDPMLNVNDYAYSDNNPVGWVDPMGLGAVRAPGFWESLIPVWGSGRQAIHRFQTGHPFRGIGNAALAVSDVFLVRSIVTGVAKVGIKGVGKLGGLIAGRGVAKRALRPVANQAGKVLIRRGASSVARQPAFAPGKWLSHFAKHGAEFGAANSVEYLRMARALFKGGKGVRTYVRANGDKLFYKAATNEFGVLAKDGRTIRTFFKPREGMRYWLRQTR